MTHLDGMAWPAVARIAAETVLVIPLGSTEQHGLHLPLATDTDVATAVALRLSALAERRRGGAGVALRLLR